MLTSTQSFSLLIYVRSTTAATRAVIDDGLVTMCARRLPDQLACDRNMYRYITEPVSEPAITNFAITGIVINSPVDTNKKRQNTDNRYTGFEIAHH